MKILIPFHSDTDIESAVISGGIEKFASLLYDTYDEVEVVQVTKADRTARLAKKITENHILNSAPDMILINEFGHYNHIKQFGIRTIMVCHEPVDRSIRLLGYGKIIKEMIENGDHLYFVSRRQFLHYQEQIKRIDDIDLAESDIAGYVTTSYCGNMPYTEDKRFDSITVGRNSPDKDPFHLHRIMKDSQYDSMVVTNNPVYHGADHNRYVEKNRDWTTPQMTLFGEPHHIVMRMISESRVYFSTCPIESWGITAMEALGCGVPLILATDKTGMHSSEGIAPAPFHYIKVPKSATRQEFIEAYERLREMPDSLRKEIADRTREKHSFENWKTQFDKAFEIRSTATARKTNTNSLENFFND